MKIDLEKIIIYGLLSIFLILLAYGIINPVGQEESQDKFYSLNINGIDLSLSSDEYIGVLNSSLIICNNQSLQLQEQRNIFLEQRDTIITESCAKDKSFRWCG